MPVAPPVTIATLWLNKPGRKTLRAAMIIFFLPGSLPPAPPTEVQQYYNQSVLWPATGVPTQRLCWIYAAFFFFGSVFSAVFIRLTKFCQQAQSQLYLQNNKDVYIFFQKFPFKWLFGRLLKLQSHSKCMLIQWPSVERKCTSWANSGHVNLSRLLKKLITSGNPNHWICVDEL